MLDLHRKKRVIRLKRREVARGKGMKSSTGGCVIVQGSALERGEGKSRVWRRLFGKGRNRTACNIKTLSFVRDKECLVGEVEKGSEGQGAPGIFTIKNSESSRRV